jgi:hypothetical protein
MGPPLPAGLRHRRRAHAAAIGEPEMVDTRNDPRLSRIFANKVIKRYPAFAEFYGMEDAIEQVVSYFRTPRRGWRRRSRSSTCWARWAAARASLAERLKQLMQQVPFYAIKGSPVNESPLGLFDAGGGRADPGGGVRHPARYLNRILSPLGGEAAAGVRRRHPQVQGGQALPVASSSRSRSPRPSRATRTTRTSPRWSARSTSASSRPTPRTTPTPTATPAACAWPTRACWSSSRCSRRRSRCCTRC